jgi:hypothetical protein
MAHYRRISTIACLGLLAVLLSLSIFFDPFTEKKTPLSVPASTQKTYFPQTRQEVRVHFIAGRERGPTLLIFGGIHGDEAAGYLAAERFTTTTLRKGNLIVAPRLNAAAIAGGTRQGLGGDMNRLFDLTDEASRRNPDAKVVELAKTLIQQADYVLNLHQAYDFYAPRWISRHRNPSRWGQSNVIDAPIYHLPNGEKLEIGRYAQAVSRRSNERIKDKNYHFLVNDTNTAGSNSRHGEQRGSLTYYALTKQHRIALGVEATKNCSLPQAVGFLTIAINTAMEEAGIQPDAAPHEDFRLIRLEMEEKSPKS